MNMFALLKKAVVIYTALFLSFGLFGVRAEAETVFEPKVPVISIDGQELLLDVPPQIHNGRVLVPLRGVFEKLGAVVVWEPKTGSITVSTSSKKIELRLKSQVVIINNEEKNLDVAPFIINGRTMIPLRFVSENLSAEVEWIAASKMVKIIAPNKRPEVILSQTGSAQPISNNGTQQNQDSNEEAGKVIVELVSGAEEVKVGQTFDVQVWVRGVADLYTMEVQMAFDPAFLQVKSLKGVFLGGSDIIKSIDKNKGTIDHVSTKLGQIPGRSGEGVLTSVTFLALKEGSTEICLTGDEVQMVSSLGRFIDYSKRTEFIEISITNN